jgi:hypothetical protein
METPGQGGGGDIVGGARSSRVFCTNHLLDMDCGNPDDERLVAGWNPLVWGSDLVAHGAAVKLQHAGAGADAQRVTVSMGDDHEVGGGALLGTLPARLESWLAHSYFRHQHQAPLRWLGGSALAGAALVAPPLPRGLGATTTGGIAGVQLSEAAAAGEGGGAGEGRRWQPADAVVVAGRLIPNSELLMEAGLGVSLPSRQPELRQVRRRPWRPFWRPL